MVREAGGVRVDVGGGEMGVGGLGGVGGVGGMGRNISKKQTHKKSRRRRVPSGLFVILSYDLLHFNLCGAVVGGGYDVDASGEGGAAAACPCGECAAPEVDYAHGGVGGCGD